MRVDACPSKQPEVPLFTGTTGDDSTRGSGDFAVVTAAVDVDFVADSLELSSTLFVGDEERIRCHRGRFQRNCHGNGRYDVVIVSSSVPVLAFTSTSTPAASTIVNILCC